MIHNGSPKGTGEGMTLVAELIHAVGELPVVEVDVNVVRSWVQFVAEVTAVVVIVLAVRKRSDNRIEALIKGSDAADPTGLPERGASLEDLSEKLGQVTETVRTLETSHQEQRVLVIDVRERSRTWRRGSTRTGTRQPPASRHSRPRWSGMRRRRRSSV